MKTAYRKDNKEGIPFEHYLEEYHRLNPEEAAERLNISYDRERQVFNLRLMGQEHEVGWPQFQVEQIKGNGIYSALIETIPAKISVIRFLCNGIACEHSGKFLTFREFPWGEMYYQPFKGRCLMRLAYGYANKLEQFAAKMERLGAKKIDQGDMGYEFEYLNGYYVRFLLWSGDEEFAPSSQILFSDNFLLSFQAEDLAVVGDIAIGMLKNV